MCGRYALARTTDDLVREYDIDRVGWDDPPAPDYNITPTRPVPIVLRHPTEPVRQLGRASWGLVPRWAKDRSGAAKMINARAETVAAKPAYRSALARRRCLVPADGWFEWAAPEDGGGAKRPHYVTPRDGGLLTFAGLYEQWDGEGGPLVTCTILTTEARGELTRIHPRMPVVLNHAARARWLDPAAEPAVPQPDDELLSSLELRPVGRAVGNVRNNGPQLLEPASAPPQQQVLDLF